jgi:hypothetical protein
LKFFDFSASKQRININMHLKLGNRKEFFPAENRFDSLFISEIFWEGKQRNQLLLLSFSRFSTLNLFPSNQTEETYFGDAMRHNFRESRGERERGRERSKL